MTKYRFYRYEDGSISVRAERKIANRLLASITKVISPNEDVSAAMKELYQAVHGATLTEPFAPVRASKARVRE